MKIPDNGYRCPLGKYQPRQTDTEAIKRTGWKRDGLLVISPQDERLDWVERELLQRIGERIYGNREVQHG